jgi:hypothetical protein
MTDQVGLDELQIFEPRGIRIDPGGNAVLHSCRHAGREYLFKRFTREHLGDVDDDALLRLVRWRIDLPAADRAQLDEITAWPRYAVRLGDRLIGVLIPAAEVRFLARSRNGTQVPRGLVELPGAGQDGRVPESSFAVLGRLIAAVRWLHRHNVVVNDLQPDNVLCAVAGPTGGVYLVDCDSMISMRHWGRVAVPAAPDLMDEVQPTRQIPTVGTDLSKLMWVIARILLEAPNQVGLGPRDRALLAAAVPVETRDLLLGLLDQPEHAASWDRLAELWCGLPVPADEPAPGAVPPDGRSWQTAPAVPVRRGSWLPTGFAYRPEPGPPVFPVRLRRGAGHPTASRRLLAAAGALAGITAVALTLIVGLQMGYR